MAHLIINDKVIMGGNEMPTKRFKELIGNINMTDEDLIKVLNMELFEINKLKSIKICKMITASKKDVRICYEEYENKDLKKGNINPNFKTFMINKRYQPNI